MARFALVACTAWMACATGLSAAEPPRLEMLLSADEAASRAEVERLRKRGPEALRELLALRERVPDSQRKRFDQLVDAVGGARYCSVSRLFWHTSFERARDAAKESGKPILSLRMMGKLTDEFSCANSRFFRTTLYANEEIAQRLREDFVLHWKSVRPVPKVVVDFGDGRKLERTLTGNSIHYVLDAEGRVLDGLPGLYGPRPFHSWLDRMKSLHVALRKADQLQPPQRDSLLRSWHGQRIAEINRRWKADLQELNVPAAPPQAKPRADAGPPPARDAAKIAVPKSIVEMPLIANVTLSQARSLERRTTEGVWKRLAKRHAKDAALDESSRRLIASENPTAAEAPRPARTRDDVESPLVRMLARFESSIALDTVRNEYQLHRRLHRWFATGEAAADVDALNEKVYAELFLTPGSDPWIGLVPEDTYTGLVDGGVVRDDE